MATSVTFFQGKLPACEYNPKKKKIVFEFVKRHLTTDDESLIAYLRKRGYQEVNVLASKMASIHPSVLKMIDDLGLKLVPKEEIQVTSSGNIMGTSLSEVPVVKPTPRLERELVHDNNVNN